jgi:phosphatidate cytidylyltransferase
MKKILQRLLMFCIAVPLAIFIVVYLPQKNHLAANVVVIVLSALGSVEFANMFKKKNQGRGISLIETLLLGVAGPVVMTLSVSFDLGYVVLSVALVLGASWLLVSRAFLPKDKLQDVTGFVAAGFSIMIYPGLFMLWIIRMSLFPHADMVILMFLLTVIANDSVAWAAGMLLGEGNRGIIPASPNKSVAGFIGGFAASILVGIGAVLFIPQAFTPTRLPSIPAGIILGLLSGIAAALGDLAESALKRSVNIKDSGSLILGRGGVLDSIDSLALAAPVFYFLFWLLFT